MPEHVLMSEMETITDGGRRRRGSASEKMRIVDETLEEGTGTSVVVRRNGVAPNLLNRRREEGEENSPVGAVEEVASDRRRSWSGRKTSND